MSPQGAIGVGTSFRSGEALRMIHRQLLRLPETCGVRSYRSVGQKFDPSLHEAAEIIPNGEHEERTIVREVQRGYRWDDHVLRPARVVITSAESDSPAPGSS